MAKLPVRLKAQEHRLPEIGLLKFGDMREGVSKQGKKYTSPTTLTKFRFCSSFRDALEQVAAIYGGHVEEWTNGFGKQWWQVRTEASSIRVVIPPNALNQHYELWKGRACSRRCDGEICEVPRGMANDPNPEPMQVPCICNDEGALSCKPTTRLLVIIPEISPFQGVFRMDCKGDRAREELPAMVAAVTEMQGRGMAYGVLSLQQRSENGYDPKQGKRGQANYVTPILAPAASFDQLVAGDARARALGPAGSALALPVSTTHQQRHDVDPNEELVGEDDDIDDAEIVEDAMSDLDRGEERHGRPRSGEAGQGMEPTDEWDDPDTSDQAVEDEMKFLRSRIAMDLGSDEVRHALAAWVSRDRTTSTRELTLEELRRLADGARKVKRGEVRVEIVDGRAKVEKVA